MKMKKTLLSTIFSICCLSAFCQYEVGISIGSALVTHKPKNVNTQSSLAISGYIHREFHFATKFIFEPGLSLSANRIFIDGNFSKGPNGQTVFGMTPSNYKQSRLDLTSVRVPLLIKYQLFANSKGEGISFGIGPYFEYLLSAKQSYKIDAVNFTQQAPLDNRLHMGIAVDFGTSGKVFGNNRFGFGAGIQYQFTNYLENNSSFKPLLLYTRIGFRF